MKTSELAGAMLAYWVAKAEGLENALIVDGECMYIHHHEPDDDGWWTGYDPHEDWAIAGPIISQYHISLDGGSMDGEDWHASTIMRPISGPYMAPCYRMIDKSPLVAAMRAYVAGKYGMELPEAA